MRVLDLLLWLQDQPRTQRLYLQTATGIANIQTFKTQTVMEQPQLVFWPKTAGRTLQVWEAVVLLDQKALRQHFVYVQEEAGPRAVFGLRHKENRLVIN